MQIFKDLSTAIQITKEIRRARSSGTDEVRVQTVRRMSIDDWGYWPWTLEGNNLDARKDYYQKAKTVFLTFSEDVQHALARSPKSGEWLDRLALWRKQLKSTLPHEDACFLAQVLAHEYANTKRRLMAAEQKGGEQK